MTIDRHVGDKSGAAASLPQAKVEDRENVSIVKPTVTTGR